MKSAPILIGISMASLGVIGFYLLYKRKQSIAQKRSSRRIEVQIPNACVPYVLGKYGCAVKTLQEKCSVKIKFISPALCAVNTTCVVKGEPGNVELTECIIKSIIKNFQNEVESGVCKMFNKVKVDKGSENILLGESGAEIYGDILKLIASDVSENDDIEPAITPALNYNLVKNISDYKDHNQTLQSVGGDNLIPVYVSAVTTPSIFWVQVTKTKEHAELDLITDELYDFYDFNPDLNHPPEYDTVKVGNLYAIFCENDKRWYRAEVCAVGEKDEMDPRNSMIDVYLLDYGESTYQKLKNLRIIPLDFLQLKFQAIDCSLANIKPPKEDEWEEEQIVKFENLVHSGEWYTLQARVEYNIEKSSRIIPCLTLIDANLDGLNINNELVNSGYARFAS